jgi:hypothetical protein
MSLQLPPLTNAILFGRAVGCICIVETIDIIIVLKDSRTPARRARPTEREVVSQRND